MFENLPQDIKINGLFCGWKLTERGKTPFNLKTNSFAKSNDKNTFVDFDVALKNISSYINYYDLNLINKICSDCKPEEYEKYNNFKTKKVPMGGLGLGIFNGFSAVDIDHCVENGKINDFAQGLIDLFGCYAEFSASGTGIRILFKTKTKVDKNKYYINNQKLGLEIYVEGSTNKFVTLTGNIVYSYMTDILEVDIQTILDMYMLKPQANVKHEDYKVNYNIDIYKFVDSDKKLNDLWYSSASGSGGNESETDLALCNKLAFYCGKDKDKINEFFISSPYFKSKDKKHTDKWLVRNDYRDATIDLAIKNCNAVYNPNYKTDLVIEKGTLGFDYTDTGNAHLFIDRFGKVVKYNVDNKCWMIWNGLYWQNDYFGEIKNYAEILINDMKNDTDRILNDKDYLRNLKRLLSSNGKEMMLKEAQHLDGIPCCNNDFDKNKYYFNCKSGVLDLENNKILQHSPLLMQSKYSDVEIVKKKPERFNEFLDTIYQGNKELITYVLKCLSLSLTGDTREQKVFYLIGDGANGKSVLTDIISYVLGDYSATANSSLIIDKKTQAQCLSEVARLKGKRFVIVSETRTNDMLDEASIKNMTGGDKIVARFLYANEFEFLPEFKLWILSNYEPRIVGNDNGIKRRIKLIRHDRIFDESEQDLYLIDKLKKEKNEIFSLLVKYYKKYRDEGLKQPKVVTEWSEGYFKENDVVAQWLEENCITSQTSVSSANDLWQDFKTWYERRGEYFKFSQTLFGRNLGKKFKKITQNGRKLYIGLELRK